MKRATVSFSRPTLTTIVNGVRVYALGAASLSVQSTTLDDVFVHYTGRQLRDALQEASRRESSFMIRRG